MIYMHQTKTTMGSNQFGSVEELLAFIEAYAPFNEIATIIEAKNQVLRDENKLLHNNQFIDSDGKWRVVRFFSTEEACNEYIEWRNANVDFQPYVNIGWVISYDRVTTITNERFEEILATA